MTSPNLTSWMNIPGIYQYGSPSDILASSFLQSYHDHIRAMESVAGYNDSSLKKRKHLKARFGKKHDWYIMGWERNYGWDDPVKGNWRAIVSTRGTSFEVNENFTPEQTVEAFNQFRKIVE